MRSSLFMKLWFEESPVAKQTGRAHLVKSARTIAQRIIAVGVFALLTACASTWHNAAKSPQEAKTDARVCAAEAEETALTRSNRQRVEYGAPPSVMPGLNRGETPMQMVDRSRIEDTYTRDFESCMRSKGYSQN
jgi:hypothetical protein